jgi:hypothetical protein
MANKRWELRSAQDVAEALDWLRRRMGEGGLVLLAIGVNSIAFAKDPKLGAEDAADLIEQQLPALRREFPRIESQRVTRGCSRREDL